MKPPVEVAPKKAANVVRPPTVFEAQIWRRRSAAGWGALITLVSCVIASVVALLLVLVVLLYVTLLSRILPTRVGSWIASGLELAGGPLGIAVITALIIGTAWYFGHRIFKRDTTAGLLGRLGARVIDEDDNVEQQLVATIRQASAAIGTPVPSVLLFESPACNAAAIGDAPESAGLLISRDLLELLDPSQLRAVLAHLFSSVVNGDLRVTDSAVRGVWLLGMMATLLDVPFSPAARRSLSVLLRHAFPSAKKAELVSRDVDAAFARTLHPDGLESLSIFLRKLAGEENDLRSIASTVLSVLLLPVLLVRAFVSVFCSVSSLLLLGPVVTLILRGRRRLADRTAVELTDDSSSLKGALLALDGLERRVPLMGWSEMHFMVGPDAANAEVFARLREWVSGVLAEVNNFSGRLRRKSTAGVSTTKPTSFDDDRITSRHEMVFGFHPPLGQRIAALEPSTKGATATPRDSSTWVIVGFLALGIFCVLVIAIPALRRW